VARFSTFAEVNDLEEKCFEKEDPFFRESLSAESVSSELGEVMRY
jgi:hypothetical protein